GGGRPVTTSLRFRLRLACWRRGASCCPPRWERCSCRSAPSSSRSMRSSFGARGYDATRWLEADLLDPRSEEVSLRPRCSGGSGDVVVPVVTSGYPSPKRLGIIGKVNLLVWFGTREPSAPKA